MTAHIEIVEGVSYVFPELLTTAQLQSLLESLRGRTDIHCTALGVCDGYEVALSSATAIQLHFNYQLAVLP